MAFGFFFLRTEAKKNCLRWGTILRISLTFSLLDISVPPEGISAPFDPRGQREGILNPSP